MKSEYDVIIKSRALTRGSPDYLRPCCSLQFSSLRGRKKEPTHSLSAAATVTAAPVTPSLEKRLHKSFGDALQYYSLYYFHFLMLITHEEYCVSCN